MGLIVIFADASARMKKTYHAVTDDDWCDDGLLCPQADGQEGCCVGHPDWTCARMTLERMARKGAHSGDHQDNIMKTYNAVMDGDCDGVECPQADGSSGCCVGHPDWVCCALGLVCASDPSYC